MEKPAKKWEVMQQTDEIKSILIPWLKDDDQ